MGLNLHLMWDDLERQEKHPYPHPSEIRSDCLRPLVYRLYYGHILKCDYPPDVFGILAERFDIDLRPLEKVFNPNEDKYPEDWEAKAQPPAELADCLRRLIQALDRSPEALSEKDLAPRLPRYVDSQLQQRYCKYFLEGEFRSNLAELLVLAEWAIENDEPRVRLYLG